MGGEWTAFRLGDVCSKIGSGATPRGGSSVYLDRGEVALIRSQNVHNDGLHRDGVVYLTTQHAAELDNVAVEVADVLLNITGDSVARACQIDPTLRPARVNQHVAIIRPDRRVLWPRFLRYLLVAPGMQARLLAMASAGATRNALTKGMIEALAITAPADVDEQRRIAAILGVLDDKIDLNRRTSETLEAMARALFKSWFVDFDPVRTKAEGRETGLVKELADLFPALFVRSDSGLIPDGWAAKPLGDWVDVLSGGTPSLSEPSYWGGDLPWISPKVMTAIHADEAGENVTAVAIGNGTRLAPPGATLVMVRGMGLHRAVRVSQARRAVTFNQDVKALVGRCIDSTLLLFALLDAQASLLEKVETSGHGTGKLASDVLLSHPLVMPGAAIQRQLSEPLRLMNDRIAVARGKSRSLAALRDTLLPKLISGELRIPDAERIVGEVA